MTARRLHRALLAVPLLLSLLLPATAALADSRSDWRGYDWKTVPRATCPDLGAAAPCPFFSAKWDWKRSQWVRLELSQASGGLRVQQWLDNRDRKDDDYVCTVILFQDAEKANVAALFFNEHTDPQTVQQSDRLATLAAPAAARIAFLTVGTKQCREGPDQDRALFEQVQSGLR